MVICYSSRQKTIKSVEKKECITEVVMFKAYVNINKNNQIMVFSLIILKENNYSKKN